MKKIVLICVLIAYSISFSQVAIGDIDPHPHAQLDVSATQKGILIPRIPLQSETSPLPISSDPDALPLSLLVFNTNDTATDLAIGYYYWYNARWNKLAVQSDPETASTNSWFIQNTLIPATENTQNIYQMGTVSVGKDQAIPGVALDVDGAFRAGKPTSSLPTPPIGSNSIAVGYGAVAGGENSSAWGDRTNASGENSSAWGRSTRALGNVSSAWGDGSNATGLFSTAWGLNTLALSYCETVFGQYNAIQSGIPYPNQWVASHPLLQVGNGVSDGTSMVKSNALTILKNGDTGIGIIGVNEDAKPTARLDIGSGTVRIREINSSIGVDTDKMVVVDADGVLKTIAPTGSSATTNKLESSENTMTSTVNGVAATADIINEVNNTLGMATATGYPLTTSVNGIPAPAVDIPEPWNVAGGSIKASSNTQDIYMNGNVGIGDFSKNNPSALLDVKGDALINDLTVGRGGGNISTNIATGNQALYSNTTGSSNTANGNRALYSNTTGNGNTANGNRALYSNTTGGNNTATGNQALYSNTTGGNNTANGNQALYSNTLGIYNIATGSYALYYNTEGSYNTATGDHALYYNTTGRYNTATGYYAFYRNTTGNYNTATGHYVLDGNTTGSYNTAIGYQALYFNTTGSNNTAIGYNAGPGSGSTNLSNTTAIGNGARVTATNTIRLGNTSITAITGQVAFTTSSDRRWKENIKTIPLGLEFINKVRPVEYIRKNNEEKTKEWGVIAQELQQTLEDAGYQNAGLVQGDNTPDNYLSVRYNDLIAPLIKAVQELSLQNEDLKKKNDQIKIKNDQLEQRMEKLEEIIKKMMKSL